MLAVSNLTKEYDSPAGPLRILSGINLSLNRGDAVAITGPSGSGKSTILYILGALDTPTAGSVALDGADPFSLPPNERASFRNQKIGFVFQDHCLLPQCSVLENVLIPTLVAAGASDHAKRAHSLLEQVGLSHRLDHRPAELSGGEKQRVAIARALILDPLLVLCDEPTGNLDRTSADTVAQVLLDLHARQQTILVIVTHSLELASKLPVQYELFERGLKRKG
ncbi:MAG: ABC transporter ATP-binding protein [Bryobacteraceae bacterium]